MTNSATLAPTRGVVAYSYVDDRETRSGSWTFDVAPGVTFEEAWAGAVEDFKSDPQVLARAFEAGYAFNYGDLVDEGTHVLARHGLTLATTQPAQVKVDHDTVLVDPQGLCRTCVAGLTDGQSCGGSCAERSDRD